MLAYDPGISPNDPTDAVRAWAFLVFIGCVVLVLLYLVIRHAVGDSQNRNANKVFFGGGVPQSPGFEPVFEGEQPGRFKIVGVDRETKLDTTWHCEAVSEANAKVKAELEGIIVTRVERV